MDIIHLLPDSVANQIAAGEVVQRPASVIKELMENAVDAGTSTIDVLVQDAGRTSIQVIDDGKGMSETDARMAFERHATSKILHAEDLFKLHTMGFRGEALASIAAVAQVRLTTRTADQDLGVRLSIEGSRFVGQEVCSCPVGANFEVNNLFFNVPARRKFLKTNQTELGNIIQDFERIALVNPSVTFSLTSGGNSLMQLPAGSSLQRIVNIFGKKMSEQLLPVQVETTLVRISGFVGKPESARKKGASQYLFVNGRFMRHPRFHYAVMEAFNHLIPEGEQVPYFIFFQVDPAAIDVNIHPTKTEIKFENEQEIWSIVVAAVRDALGKFNAVPTIDFDVEGRPDIPTYQGGDLSGIKAPRVQLDVSYNPFSTHSQNRNPVRHWEKMFEGARGMEQGARDMEQGLLTPNETLFPEADRSTQHFQYKGQYILTAVQSGLMIVDQRRAHERRTPGSRARESSTSATSGRCRSTMPPRRGCSSPSCSSCRLPTLPSSQPCSTMCGPWASTSRRWAAAASPSAELRRGRTTRSPSYARWWSRSSSRTAVMPMPCTTGSPSYWHATMPSRWAKCSRPCRWKTSSATSSSVRTPTSPPPGRPSSPSSSRRQ